MTDDSWSAYFSIDPNAPQPQSVACDLWEDVTLLAVGTADGVRGTIEEDRCPAGAICLDGESDLRVDAVEPVGMRRS